MKYIVYLTLNLVNFYIYIGQHKITGDGKDGYLGNGVYCHKPSSYNHPKYPFQYAVKKYGPKNFKRITLAIFDTLEEALHLEASIVTKEFLKLPYVYNIAEGGGKAKDTSKCVYQYDLTGKFIAEFNSIRDVERVLGFNHCSINQAILSNRSSHSYLWSYTKVEHLNTADYFIYNGIDNYYIYDINGKYLVTMHTAKEAADYIGCNKSNISYLLKQGKSLKGYYLSTQYTDTYIPPQKFKIRNTPIYQYNIEGDFIRKWDNCTEVWKSFNCTSCNPLANAIQENRLFKGFQWKLDY